MTLRQPFLIRLLLASSALFAPPWSEATPRSPTVRAEFQRLHPCPANGKTRGVCPGWVMDHVVPLCAGGADSVLNAQWQTTAAAKAKDRDERRACQILRRKSIEGF